MARKRVKKVSDPSKVVELLQADTGINVSDLLDQIITIWGGPDEFAMTIKTEHDAAPPGSVARQRLLAMIHDMVKYVTAQGLEKKDALEGAPTEDIEAVLRQMLQKAKA